MRLSPRNKRPGSSRQEECGEYRVKYSRREYREEYLKSDEWKILRNSIIDKSPTCEKCNRRSSRDVHHCNYRNIIDVRHSDLMAVCRECHEEIEAAKKLRIIAKNHTKNQAKEISIELINSFKLEKMEITQEIIPMFLSAERHSLQLICGILKIRMQDDWRNLVGLKLTRIKYNDVIRLLNRKSKWMMRKGSPTFGSSRKRGARY